MVFSLSYLHRQVYPPETLVVKGGITWARNGRWILSENARLPCNIQGSFTCRKYTAWDKRLYFLSEGRRTEDFFALKNPTASAGFEPTNLGTKGQHSTSGPQKTLNFSVTPRSLSLSLSLSMSLSLRISKRSNPLILTAALPHIIVPQTSFFFLLSLSPRANYTDRAAAAGRRS